MSDDHVAKAWAELLEKDDRASDENRPEMLLITYDELKDFMARAVPPAPPPPRKLTTDEYFEQQRFDAARAAVLPPEVTPEYTRRLELELIAEMGRSDFTRKFGPQRAITMQEAAALVGWGRSR